MRTSFDACFRMPWENRLSWYFDAGSTAQQPTAGASRRSRTVMIHGRKLFLRYFTLSSGDLESREEHLHLKLLQASHVA
jgi:hypothetical protein